MYPIEMNATQQIDSILAVAKCISSYGDTLSIISHMIQGAICVIWWIFSISHCGDVIMRVMTSQITTVSVVLLNRLFGADQRKHQSSASLAFVRGNSPVSGELPPQRARNAEYVPIWLRHHVYMCTKSRCDTFDVINNMRNPLHFLWIPDGLRPFGAVRPTAYGQHKESLVLLWYTE